MRDSRVATLLTVFGISMLLAWRISAWKASPKEVGSSPVPVLEATIPMQTDEGWKISDDELGWELTFYHDHFIAQRYPDQWMWAVVECWHPAMPSDEDGWSGFGVIDSKEDLRGDGKRRGSYGLGNHLRWGDIVLLQLRDQSGLRGEHIVQLGSVQ